MTRKDPGNKKRTFVIRAESDMHMILLAEIGFVRGLEVRLGDKGGKDVILTGRAEDVKRAKRAVSDVLPLLRNGQVQALVFAILAAGARPSRGLLEAVGEYGSGRRLSRESFECGN